MILLVTASELCLLYILSQNQILYYGFLAILLLASSYGIKYYWSFLDFRNNLYLFVSDSEIKSENHVEPLNMELNDASLKVCLYYRNGASLEDIQKDLGLNHPQQVKRELVKGLGFLLKFYHEHKEKEVKTV